MGLKGLLGRRALIVLALTALVIATAVSATGPTVNQQVQQANAPDMVLYDGKISTVDKTTDRRGDRDPRRRHHGDRRPERYQEAGQAGHQAHRPRGRRVLPGLIDGHIHGMREGYHCWTQVVRLDLVTSRATALAMYKAKADELADGRWIWTTSAAGTSASSTTRRSSRSTS